MDNRDRRWKLTVDDGLLLTVFKLVVTKPARIWAGSVHDKFVDMTLPYVERLCFWLFGDVSAKQEKLFAIDVYKFVMNLLVFGCYFVVVVTNRSCSGIAAGILIVFCTALCVGRLIELLSLVLVLAFDENYRPKGFARPFINTLWHFCEVSVIYAVFYACLSHFSPYAFGVNKFGSPLSESYSAAWYFSFATLSTMGYFDYAPMTALPRLLVASEVLCGYFLILIVLQRNFSSLSKDPSLLSLNKWKWNPDGVLIGEKDDYFVGVIVIIRDPNGCFLVVRKSVKDGYEFSGKSCFPGGLVRKSGDGEIAKSIVSSAIERVRAETGLTIQANQIVPLSMSQPIFTAYTKRGVKVTTLILAYYCQLLSRPLDLQLSGGSVEDPRWIDAPLPLAEFAPANALYAYAISLPCLDEPQRVSAKKELSNAMEACNKANASIGSPLIDLNSIL